MKKNSVPATVWRNPIHFVACGFGSGAMPVAPGTFGTLAAIPVYLLMQPLPMMLYILLTAILFIVGVWLCHSTARDFGVADHGGIVWDEIVGFLVTMVAAPAGWQWIGVGFILFRLFDIIKPWPISWIDKRIHGGLGIMMDDVLAGVYAYVCLQLIYRWDVLTA
jgi:phosphatidylglycerophosphatase A